MTMAILTKIRNFTTLFLLLGLFACTNQEKNLPEIEVTRIECTNPRPEICTQDYRPVCATKDNGVRCVTTPCDSTDEVTYSNACSACADSDVYSYQAGACE